MSVHSSSGPGYFEVIIIALLTAVASLIGYDRIFAQKIKTFDLKEYLRTQNELLASGDINKEEWAIRLDALEQALNHAAAGHRNHVILLKDVALRNGEEIQIAQ